MGICLSMDKLKAAIYFFLLSFLIFGIASFMEFYKKKIRKDKVKHIEAHIISIVLSVGAIAGLDFLHVFTPFINYCFPGSPVWMDYVLQIGIIYFLQYQADMKVLKNLIKLAAVNLLSKYGINLKKEDINSLLKNSNTK